MSSDYKDLKAWQKAFALVNDIYTATAAFPKTETFGLASQMRRSAVSIPSNIAEGRGRYSKKEFAQFLYVARGSLLELETQILIAKKQGFIATDKSCDLTSQTLEISKILNGLITSLRVVPGAESGARALPSKTLNSEL